LRRRYEGQQQRVGEGWALAQPFLGCFLLCQPDCQLLLPIFSLSLVNSLIEASKTSPMRSLIKDKQTFRGFATLLMLQG
jgi:hypothetical protein